MATISHNHTCKHCDMHWGCAAPCPMPYDVSKWHDCAERVDYARHMRWIMADYKPCKLGCKSLPCVHDRQADKRRQSSYRDPSAPEPEYQRPQVRVLNGKQVVNCKRYNGHTSAMLEAGITLRKDERGDEPDTTTRYASDGAPQLRAQQAKLTKAILLANLDEFPEHLRELIKESRTKG